jgi:predicted AAA+ superfamily ATPase
MALVSFKYNIVFVKTQKTAGSSIEVDLGARLEESAVVTPVYPEPKHHVARNFETDAGVFYNHMSAREIRDLIGETRFAQMFKFCVERDPITKCLSHYHMLRNSSFHNPDGEYRLSWDEYVENGNFPLDIDKYTETISGNRKVIVDQILRYETLATELPALLKLKGIADFILQASEKSEYSKRVLVNRSEVTENQRDAILSAFSETQAIMAKF